MKHSDFVPRFEPFPRLLFETVARDIVKDSDIICLGGAFLGYSACLMMEQLELAGKRAELYAFDLFGTDLNATLPSLTPWGEPMSMWVDRIGGRAAILDQFLININNSPARHRLTDWCQAPTLSYFGGFEINSLGFMFLSANTEEAKVSLELAGWWPRVRPGGLLSVYGADHLGVGTAVQRFSDSCGSIPSCTDNTYTFFK